MNIDNESRRNFFKNSSLFVAGVPLMGLDVKNKEKNKRGQRVLSTTNSPVKVTSPDGHISIELGILYEVEDWGIPYYTVIYQGKAIILESKMGMELNHNSSIGSSSKMVGVTVSSNHEEYHQSPGKRYEVKDHYTEVTMHLVEVRSSDLKWSIVARVYNDGVAFRYVLESGTDQRVFEIREENTQFSILPDSRVWTLPLNSFTESAYEVFYAEKMASEIPADWLLGVPLLIENDTTWMAISEANLTDYAGMYLEVDHQGSSMLKSRLSPLPDDSEVAVRGFFPHLSPWRVFMIGSNAGKLIESDLILNLNRPCAIDDTSWVKSGKTTFPWWNGFYLDNVSFEPGLNTKTMKYYIDFCSENDIPYHSLDGVHRTAWYGGPTHPYKKGQDITTAVPEIDMPELLAYAQKKNVRLRLWMHWEAVGEQMDEAFPLYKSWGIEGVMLDFMNRDDQEMVVFLEKVLIKAAENQLTVTLHGASKPTGLERTYPHLLTHEAVRNFEYDKFREEGIPPAHEVTVPYARMLAGPLDFHQGSFRGVSVDQFQPRGIAPNVMGTLSRTLANYVVLQNHLPMMADYPSAYRQYPLALSVLSKIPTTWDDTHFISGRIGEFICLARQKGSKWYIGTMNDNHVLKLNITLDFLPSGKYKADIYSDDIHSSNPYRGFQSSEKLVESGETIEIELTKAGGNLIVLSKA